MDGSALVPQGIANRRGAANPWDLTDRGTRREWRTVDGVRRVTLDQLPTELVARRIANLFLLRAEWDAPGVRRRHHRFADSTRAAHGCSDRGLLAGGVAR